MAKRKTFTYISGPAHGWLSVSHKDIPEELKDDISVFSYMTFTRVYLEEDSDMPKFLHYLDERGIEYTIKQSYTENEYVRSFGSYVPKYLGIKIFDNVELHNGEKVHIVPHVKSSSLILKREDGKMYRTSKNKIIDYLKK